MNTTEKNLIAKYNQQVAVDINDKIQQKCVELGKLKANTVKAVNNLLTAEIPGLQIDLGITTSYLYFNEDSYNIIEMYHDDDVDGNWDFRMSVASCGSFSLIGEETSTSRYYNTIAKILTNKTLVNVLNNVLYTYVTTHREYKKELAALHTDFDELTAAIVADAQEQV